MEDLPPGATLTQAALAAVSRRHPPLNRAAKAALLPVLFAQALATRRRAIMLPEAEGPRDGSVGEGRPLRVLIVGDSSAAGVGVRTQDEALAGHLTRTLAQVARAQVLWQVVAKSGISTAQALALVQRAMPRPADLAVVTLGVNDVIEQVPSLDAVRQRAALADWLTNELQVRHVVFMPLPPMHRFPLLPQPLRWIAGLDARAHDRAMALWAAGRERTWHVPIEVDVNPQTMAEDGFHPNEQIYRHCGETAARFIAATVLAAGLS